MSGQTSGQGDIPGASAGTPGGLAPSGATSPGTTPVDAQPAVRDDEQGDTVTPGQPAGSGTSPVPSPGDTRGAVPAVAAGQAADPEDGIVAGAKAPDSDASVASPGSYVALAPPGHPDGEVDTRAR